MSDHSQATFFSSTSSRTPSKPHQALHSIPGLFRYHLRATDMAQSTSTTSTLNTRSIMRGRPIANRSLPMPTLPTK